MMMYLQLSFINSDICSAFSQSFSVSLDVTKLALFLHIASKCSLPRLCPPPRRMRMRATEEILYIVEIEDRYIRNDGRTADIYIQTENLD